MFLAFIVTAPFATFLVLSHGSRSKWRILDIQLTHFSSDFANQAPARSVSHVPKNDLQVTIEIPNSTNLYVRMRGGDLSVLGITGDKDLGLTGGDLTVQVGNPEDYSHVDLSVRFGDISGTQFGDPKGMIGNAVRREGNGKYRLHAHVMAGDLMLKS